MAFLAPFFLLMWYALVRLSKLCYKKVNKQVERKIRNFNLLGMKEKSSETIKGKLKVVELGIIYIVTYID